MTTIIYLKKQHTFYRYGTPKLFFHQSSVLFFHTDSTSVLTSHDQ
jgi:hypothetical protein